MAALRPASTFPPALAHPHIPDLVRLSAITEIEGHAPTGLEPRSDRPPAKFGDMANAVHGRTASSRGPPLAVAIERTMWYLTTRLPYTSAHTWMKLQLPQ